MENSANKRRAILSSCFGSIPMVMVQDSAVIMLFATMLGAGETTMMLTTAAPGVMNCLLMAPAALFATRAGYRKSVAVSCWWGAASLLFLAACPWMGGMGPAALLLGVFSFGGSLALYFSAWVPFMTTFLEKDERSAFLGLKRFCWLLTAALFFFLCGLMIGKNPPMWKLQAVIVVTAAALLARAFLVDRIKASEEKAGAVPFLEGFKRFAANKPLAGFSVYLAFLYLAANSTIPLALVFLKKQTSTPDNVVVMISSLALCGTLSGYLCCGRLGWSDTRKMLLGAHCAFAFVCLGLFFVAGDGFWHVGLMASLLVVFGFFSACASVAVGTEIMALASPRNKAVDMAFASVLYAGGVGGSRLLSALVMGSGALSARWRLGPLELGPCQTLWLACAVAVALACLLLPFVPAVFPEGKDSSFHA